MSPFHLKLALLAVLGFSSACASPVPSHAQEHRSLQQVAGGLLHRVVDDVNSLLNHSATTVNSTVNSYLTDCPMPGYQLPACIR